MGVKNNNFGAGPLPTAEQVLLKAKKIGAGNGNLHPRRMRLGRRTRIFSLSRNDEMNKVNPSCCEDPEK